MNAQLSHGATADMNRRRSLNENFGARTETMTELSGAMKEKICIYCGNNQGGCAAEVPYYCVSLYCGFFVEKGGPIEKNRKRDYSKRKIMRSLVDTF